jgi:penicillin-binding protein 1A
MTDILRTTVTNGIAGRAAIGTQPVGGKTGTTSDNMDAWFCGFTPQFSAAVWIGNDVNIELSRGSAAAASLWSKVMKRVCSGYSYGSFRSRPSDVYVGSDGEYYVTGTSRTGPSVGSGSSEREILTDEDGNKYYLDSSGNKVYVDEDGNRIDAPEEEPDETDETDPDKTKTDNNENTAGTTSTDTPSTGGTGTTPSTDPGTTATPDTGTQQTTTPTPPNGVINDPA